MRIGVVFPQTEIGGDPGAVRAYAVGVEELGYRHILAYEHVLGADPSHHPGWNGPYDVDSRFHEPFVLYGYLAAITSLELVTGVVVLPQRQTPLVAKQAAEVDLLTEGRFRLGIGLGWNPVEFEAMGKSFTDRGHRVSEQVALLRRLWTERTVTFHGTYETVNGAGLAPLPVQRPIPIWFGASSPRALDRAGRLADGWFPQVQPGPALDDALDRVRRGALSAGRDPATIGMEGRINLADGVDRAHERATSWRAAGASHISFNTMGRGDTPPVGIDRHLATLAELAQALLPPPSPTRSA